jgi:hypothetical protein
MIPFSWGAFMVYLSALTLMVAGGLWGLYASGHPAFLAPILMGLFYFYLCWQAVIGTEVDPPKQKQGR